MFSAHIAPWATIFDGFSHDEDDGDQRLVTLFNPYP